MRLSRILQIVLILTLAASFFGGCAQDFEQSFQVACLSYGEPGIPYGSLVVADYAPESQWTTQLKVELARQATLLFPPPYHVDQGVPHLSISSGYKDKNSALWVAAGGETGGARFEISMLQRATLLWANNPGATAAVVLYANQTATSIRPTRFGREVVGLTSNACSVAVIQYAQPTQFNVIASASYARPGWFDDNRLGYVSRSDYLIVRGTDTATVDTLAAGVESFATAPAVGVYVICYKGDSLAVFNAMGDKEGEVIQGASVPAISPDGRWLAYHAADHGLWARDLESGVEHELGIGYPVNWAPDQHLLLFFERRVNDENEAETLFHVCEPLSGSVKTLEADGSLVDAILLK